MDEPLFTHPLTEELIQDARRRDDVVAAYVEELRRDHRLRRDFYDYDRCDWARINRAIRKRWSEAALRYIKERAWRLFDLDREGP